MSIVVGSTGASGIGGTVAHRSATDRPNEFNRFDAAPNDWSMFLFGLPDTFSFHLIAPLSAEI